MSSERTELTPEERNAVARKIAEIREHLMRGLGKEPSWSDLAVDIHATTGARVSGEALRKASRGDVGLIVARTVDAYLAHVQDAVADALNDDHGGFSQDPARDVTRERVLTLLADQISPQTAAYIRSLPTPTVDPGEEYWEQQVLAAERRRRQFEQNLKQTHALLNTLGEAVAETDKRGA